ncbi:nesprin-1-like [Pseudochaenichthys georgianus]|uniref:nesprin-1-like n=1 Tax=Pseudochaenichthys georgianus TaxID=52239 RepID=UPI00146B6E7D|nr:nesprin-1-like [Pseudochaenichthys georgianus]
MSYVLQVLQTDLRKKLLGVQKLQDQASANLQDFLSQRKQLQDYITQMFLWLKGMEDPLMSSPSGSAPEDICRVKEVQKELQTQQGGLDASREALNSLCRKFPSQELADLGSDLTELIKTFESLNQLSARTLGGLQTHLQTHFTDLVQEFHRWLLEQKEIVKECSDRSGDTNIVERKLQKLKGAMQRVGRGSSASRRCVRRGSSCSSTSQRAARARCSSSSPLCSWTGTASWRHAGRTSRPWRTDTRCCAGWRPV